MDAQWFESKNQVLSPYQCDKNRSDILNWICKAKTRNMATTQTKHIHSWRKSVQDNLKPSNFFIPNAVDRQEPSNSNFEFSFPTAEDQQELSISNHKFHHIFSLPIIFRESQIPSHMQTAHFQLFSENAHTYYQSTLHHKFFMIMLIISIATEALKRLKPYLYQVQFVNSRLQSINPVQVQITNTLTPHPNPQTLTSPHKKHNPQNRSTTNPKIHTNPYQNQQKPLQSNGSEKWEAIYTFLNFLPRRPLPEHLREPPLQRLRRCLHFLDFTPVHLPPKSPPQSASSHTSHLPHLSPRRTADHNASPPATIPRTSSESVKSQMKTEGLWFLHWTQHQPFIIFFNSTLSLSLSLFLIFHPFLFFYFFLSLLVFGLFLFFIFWNYFPRRCGRKMITQ